MSSGELVLDNSILSAFHECGWFRDIEHWQAEYSIYTSARIWEEEFAENRAGTDVPPWLEVREIPLPGITHLDRSLGKPDWSLIYLAHGCSDPTLVTNDVRLKETTEEEELTAVWGSKFLKQTFESCGISVNSYRTNLDIYLEDSFLGPEVESVLESAEKR